MQGARYGLVILHFHAPLMILQSNWIRRRHRSEANTLCSRGELYGFLGTHVQWKRCTTSALSIPSLSCDLLQTLSRNAWREIFLRGDAPTCFRVWCNFLRCMSRWWIQLFLQILHLLPLWNTFQHSADGHELFLGKLIHRQESLIILIGRPCQYLV